MAASPWKRIAAGIYSHEPSGLIVEHEGDEWLVVVPGEDEDLAGSFTHMAKAQKFVEMIFEYLATRSFEGY